MKHVSVYVLLLCLLSILGDCKVRDKGWWKHAVFYQIYSRSFMDSNGDGIGDLKGITTKLTHLADLGVQALRLTSINPSPLYFGNDVTDYKDIDPSLGNHANLNNLLHQAKQLGLKIILDLVPNHTSDKHYWFEKSVKNEGKYADYYIWAVGKNNNKQAPNNWIGADGGSAWTYNERRKMWYLHQFQSTQPDLNYSNPHIKTEMEEILRYWLKEGVDGFCIKNAEYIFEDYRLRDEISTHQRIYANEDHGDENHSYTKNHPKTYDLVQSWSRILDDYANQHNSTEKVLLTEAHTNLRNVMKFYTAGSQVPFNLKLIFDLDSSSTADEFKRVIDDWMKALPKDGVPNWMTGNEEHERIASRYPNREDQMVKLVMILPGVALTYYGDEIGMVDNTNITFNETQDILARAAGPILYKNLSLDPFRTPYQWDNTTNAGFSNATKTWLPVHKNYQDINLAKQKNMYKSHYKVYQQLTNLRKSSAALKHGGLKTMVIEKDVLMIVRNTTREIVTLFINFSKVTKYNVPLPNQSGKSNILITSIGSFIWLGKLANQTVVVLPANAAAVVHTNLTSTGTIPKSLAPTLQQDFLNYFLVLICVWIVTF